MSGWRWKVNRLRTMSVGELGWRVRQAVFTGWQRQGGSLAMHPPAPSERLGHAWCDPMSHPFNADTYVSAANRILAGRHTLFALKDINHGFPVDWNIEPRTGVRVSQVFGKSIDVRNESVVGNIKYFWEQNRHLELVTLAQAFHLTGDQRFAAGCRTLLESWLDQCRYPLGPNWTSSLECGVRLVNWAVTWHLLTGSGRHRDGESKPDVFAGPDGRAFRRRWMDSIYQHCHFIFSHRSLHSSANNHLLGEYMGLLVASVTWPAWRESTRWQSAAARGFEAEALRQNTSDGVNREQAVYYQHEVMDMMVICGQFGAANGVPFGQAYWDRLERMMEFIAALMDRSGTVPMIGDADDALIVRLSQEQAWSPYRSLLASGAVLFKRGDFKAKAGTFDDKSRWLLGDRAASAFDALAPSGVERPRQLFSEGGYYVLGSRFGQTDEIRAVVDCGPLGYPSIAAHGHADALSFIVSAGGRQLLVDPGTYSYRSPDAWRDYFRGTRAHNTMCVDARNQSKIGGGFLWLDHATAQCDLAEITGARQRFRGRHDGYRRLADPVIHHREITFAADTNTFAISDTLECLASHVVELCWHFSEECAVIQVNRSIVATSGPVVLTMTMACDTLEPALIRGPELPGAGWISRAFDEKCATTSVIWAGSTVGTTTWRTHITVDINHVLANVQ